MTKARHNNAPAIGYEQAIRCHVPFAREDGRMFTLAGCPSHPFYMMVRRAIDTSTNPAAVRSVVAGWHEQEYHGSLMYRWNAILALAEHGAKPFWFSTEAEAQEAHQHYLASRKASPVASNTIETEGDTIHAITRIS